MKVKMRPILFAFLCCSLCGSSASAQTDWGAVVSLQRGTRVRVSPQRLEGTLQNADDSRVILVAHGHAVDIPRSDIRRIEWAHHLAKRKTLIGFLIGWAVGTLMWRDAKAVAPVTGLGVAGIGALIGFTDGAFDHRYETVYEISPP